MHHRLYFLYYTGILGHCFGSFFNACRAEISDSLRQPNSLNRPIQHTTFERSRFFVHAGL
jgi:hypothetical protein